jgi:hypothetical protein
MPSDFFIQSRERGRVGQKLLVDILSAWNLDPEEIEDGYFPDWDIRINTGKTIEVKTDFLSEKTGNILLELDALDHSKADILAYCYGTKVIYMLSLDKARQFAHSWPYKKNVGEYKLPAAIIKRSLFLELLTPQVIEL